jgi:methyl-accepting chemotaxis protein
MSVRTKPGRDQVDAADKIYRKVVDSVKRVTDIMGDITVASHEQSQGIHQVNQAISHMDEVTQQNAALVEQAACESSGLEDQAVKLAQAVSVFRLAGPGGINIRPRP